MNSEPLRIRTPDLAGSLHAYVNIKPETKINI